jgi:release factor glutamine methyltransferase
MKVNELVTRTTEKLAEAGIESARLDAELLVCGNFVRQDWNDKEKPKNREDVIANPDREVSDKRTERVLKYAARRAMHEPMAYLLHFKEFYGKNMYVDERVLIPRPETEVLIDIAKGIMGDGRRKKILDVGTGSGNIATILKGELPDAEITASDISFDALDVAIVNNLQNVRGKVDGAITGNTYSFFMGKHNKPKGGDKLLSSNGMNFIQSDLLDDIEGRFDLIVANLPYIDRKDPSWEVSEELRFEPERALFAATAGTALMRKLVRQAPKNLEQGGHLLMEMDTRQLEVMSKFAREHGFTEVERQPFALLLKRV